MHNLNMAISFAVYLSMMKNNFDSDAVTDVICEEATTLFADCESCSCCENCCDKDPDDENDPLCNFDLDFYNLVGLNCGLWWYTCALQSYEPPG